MYKLYHKQIDCCFLYIMRTSFAYKTFECYFVYLEKSCKLDRRKLKRAFYKRQEAIEPKDETIGSKIGKSRNLKQGDIEDLLQFAMNNSFADPAEKAFFETDKKSLDEIDPNIWKALLEHQAELAVEFNNDQTKLRARKRISDMKFHILLDEFNASRDWRPECRPISRWHLDKVWPKWIRELNHRDSMTCACDDCVNMTYALNCLGEIFKESGQMENLLTRFGMVQYLMQTKGCTRADFETEDTVIFPDPCLPRSVNVTKKDRINRINF